MFVIGDYVMHNGHGLCIILDQIHNDSLNNDFYKLQTIHNKMSIMMPCDKANSFLRPILTKQNLTKAISDSVVLSSEYMKDNKERKIKFQQLITSNNITDTIQLLKMLYHLIEDKKLEKKTLGSFDTQFLQQAEKKLFNETAIVLNMNLEDAKNYIYERLKAQPVRS
ncbi:MAG: hypothetical protein K2I42_07430 [Anaeroplasmataceae bacterium]|nr:hypothetical protein [Anaeroplasmataceae bacterium]